MASTGNFNEQIPVATPVAPPLATQLNVNTVYSPNFPAEPCSTKVIGAVYDRRSDEIQVSKPTSLYHYSCLFLQAGSKNVLGRVTLPRKIRCAHLLGGTNMDLSQARFIYPETKIYNTSLWGSLRVTVPLGVRVVVKNYGLLTGSRFSKNSQLYAQSLKEDGPVLVIKGGGLLSSVRIDINPSSTLTILD